MDLSILGWGDAGWGTSSPVQPDDTLPYVLFFNYRLRNYLRCLQVVIGRTLRWIGDIYTTTGVFPNCWLST